MTEWQYVNLDHTIVTMINDNGSTSSCLVNADIVQQYLNDGNTISEVDLADAIDQKCDIVNDYRDNILNGTYTWNGNAYDTDLVSRTNLSAAVSGLGLGMTLPDNFTWRSHDNQNVPMSATDLENFARSMLGWAEALYVVSWYHKTNIAALTDSASVIAYDFSYGWTP